MRKLTTLFLLAFLSTMNAQDPNMWNSGNFGGPVTWGIPNGSDIYFSQGSKLQKGIEGTENIEVVSTSFLLDAAIQIKINGDNLYAIYGTNSENKNSITSTTLSNLGSSSSNNFSGIDNGINKFDEIDGFGLLAHNKDGVISDKLVGEDLLGNTNDSFEYVTDFIDFTINEYIAYLITDDGTANNTIEVIDFSAKSSAQNVGSILVKQAQSVFYSNGYLYVACENGEGLKIIDVSNSTSPVLAGAYDANSFTQVIVNGTTAYLRKDNVLTILDVTDSANPTYVNSKTFQNISALVKFTDVKNDKIYYVDNGIFGIIDASTLNISKKYLSALSSNWVASDNTTLVVYDNASYYFHSLEDPYNPKAYAVLAADFEPVDFVINGPDFYATTNNKLSIYNIENLATPGSDFTYFEEFSAFKITDDFAVIGEYKYSGSTKFYYFEIIDLTDKSNPTQLHLAEYPTVGTITSIELSPDNNTLYLSSELAGKVWLTIFDITNKSAPNRVHTGEIAEIDSGKDTKLGIDGTELFIVTNYLTLNNYYAAKIFAYSVEESSNPRLISGLQITESEYNNVAFLEELLFVTIPSDSAIRMYSLDGDSTFRKEWTQIKTLDLDEEPANMAVFANIEVPAFANKEDSPFKNITGDYRTGTLYKSKKTKGTGITYIKLKPKTKVQLTTGVLPAEAATGGCSVSPSGGEYDKNEVVPISANAASGWVFDNWSGDLTGSADPSYLTMSNNKNVIGNFKPILELAFNSADSQNIAVPKQGEEVYIGGALLTANGTDWKLNGITFTALEKIKPTYTRAFINYDGSTKEGTFTLDGDGYIETINFVLSKEIPEDYTLIVNFYYMFEFLPNEKGLLAPLDEIKKLGISYNRTQVNCDPIPSIEGVKIPQDTFSSNYQTIGWIWNTSLTPNEPFVTIQDAIDDPRTLDGHIIEVWEGYYQSNSSINVDKSLKFKSKDSAKNTIISSNDENNPLLNILRTETTIDGFTLTKGSWGINIDPSADEELLHNIVITNCIFSDLPNGVRINRTSSAKVILNTFEELDLAIVLEKGDSTDIIENSFIECKTAAQITNANFGSFSNNDFTISNTEYYLLKYLSTNKGMNISENIDLNRKGIIYYKNKNKHLIRKSMFREIDVFDSENFVLDSNYVSTIYMKGGKKNKITNNNVINSSENGIRVLESDEIEITNNTVRDAEKNGIYVGKNFEDFNLSLVKSNIVSGCKLNGIVVMNSIKTQIIKNEVHLNKKNGIMVGGVSGILKGNNVSKNTIVGILVGVYSKSCTLESNILGESEYGVLISDAGPIKVVNNNIYGNTKSGVAASDVKGEFLVEGNQFNKNCQAIEFNPKNSSFGKLIAKNNTIKNSTCWFTGIHIESGEAELTGNDIRGNNGAGIALYNDATAVISGNNIYDNPDFAILNDNANSNLIVDNNYWDSETGPSTEDFGGSIQFSSWLDSPISLVTSKVSDTLLTAIGLTDSMDIGFQNFVLPNDQIAVTVTDEQGWLTNGGTSQVDLTDSTIGTLLVKFQVPSDAGSSFNNKVTISAVSLSNSEMTAVDSFYILNYTPELASIKVSPDSIALGLGDSLQFRAYAIDQYEKEFSGTTNYSWSVSAGTIDSSGYFRADSTSQIVTITATETNSNISASANINVQAHTDIAETITIYPDSVVVPINGTIQFYAKGKDENGFDVEFNKLWLAVGGTIDSLGYFTAGDTDGEYFVKVRDTFSGVEATAKVIIGTLTSVETERIIPKQYSLNQNYPNPFNPSTTISYGLPFDSKVKVEIFNILGQRVDEIANGIESAGLHSTLWDAGHLSSGIYIIRINATSINSNTNFVKSIKMILMK